MYVTYRNSVTSGRALSVGTGLLALATNIGVAFIVGIAAHLACERIGGRRAGERRLFINETRSARAYERPKRSGGRETARARESAGRSKAEAG